MKGSAESGRRQGRFVGGISYRVLILSVCLLTPIVPAWSQSQLDKIKSQYRVVSAELEKHIMFDAWIDDDPQSPELLARQWSLGGEWVAAWFEAHPSLDADSIEAALSELAPTEEQGEHLALRDNTFLIVAPGPIGNVFIVTKSNGHWRLAWSTSQTQEASGEQAEILAAWRAKNAQHGGRGPYWSPSGSVGSVIPSLGKLTDDAEGHARFYIDGWYAQSAGGTVEGQISIWIWDGDTARPFVARDYTFMIDQQVRTRLEGDLLKVQQKKFFRTFYSCGGCEERQTDWTVRITPEGIEDLGERSLVPELDAVDELFYRMIKHKSAADIASPAAVEAARRIVREAQAERSPKEWKEFPTLGMMGGWKVQKLASGELLCLSTDDTGSKLFRLRSAGGRLFISDVMETEKSCAPEPQTDESQTLRGRDSQ